MENIRDETVVQEFINAKQSKPNEIIFYAQRKIFYDDILGDYDNYIEVLTVMDNGTVWKYLKDDHSNQWFRKLY